MPETSGFSEKVGNLFNRLKRPQNKPGSIQAEIDKVSREIKGKRVIEDNGSVVIDDIIINDRVVALNGSPEDTARARQQKWITEIGNAQLRHRPDTALLIAQEAVKRNKLSPEQAYQLIEQGISKKEARVAEIKRKLRTNPDAFSEFSLSEEEMKELGIDGLQSVRGGKNSYDARGYGKNVIGAQAAHRENMTENEAIFAAAEDKLAQEKKTAKGEIAKAQIESTENELKKAEAELKEKRTSREKAVGQEKKAIKAERVAAGELKKARRSVIEARRGRDQYNGSQEIQKKIEEINKINEEIEGKQAQIRKNEDQIANLQKGKTADGKEIEENDAYLYDENGALRGEVDVNKLKEEHASQAERERQRQIQDLQEQTKKLQEDVSKLQDKAEKVAHEVGDLYPENKPEIQLKLSISNYDDFTRRNADAMNRLESELSTLEDDATFLDGIDASNAIPEEILVRFDAATEKKIRAANKIIRGEINDAVAHDFYGARAGDVRASELISADRVKQQKLALKELRQITSTKAEEIRTTIKSKGRDLSAMEDKQEKLSQIVEEDTVALTKVRGNLEANNQVVAELEEKAKGAVETLHASRESLKTKSDLAEEARAEEMRAEKRVEEIRKRLDTLKVSNGVLISEPVQSTAETLISQPTRRIERQELNRQQGLRGLLGRIGRRR